MNFLKRFTSIILIVLSVLFTIPVFAQEKTDSSVNVDDHMKQMLDYSRPGKYPQLLASLAGTFTFKDNKNHRF